MEAFVLLQPPLDPLMLVRAVVFAEDVDMLFCMHSSNPILPLAIDLC
jgi:hypothetical protein